MTEFRRASAAVESIAGLVTDLTGTGGNAGADVSDEERSKFMDVQRQVAELQPTVAKMRLKCNARADLEAVKAELRRHLPGAPEEVLKAAQELVDASGEGADAVQPLLVRAHELDGLATYGAKMVEKVVDLLEKFDAAQRRFDLGVVPRLAAVVSSANAAEAARHAAQERAEEEAAAAEARRAEDEIRRPLAGLLAENEQRLREVQAAQEAAELQRAAEEEERRQADAAHEAREQALRQAEEEGERRLAEAGPDAACGEALAAMLAAPVGPYREAVEALHDLLGGIAAEPSEARLRFVRVANEGFQRRLGSRPGVWLFLRGVGFQPQTRASLPAGFLASLGLGSGPPTERFLLLEEPDMFGAYEEWLTWHTRIKAIAGFLQSLRHLAFQRIAHLGQHGNDVATHTALSAAEVMQRWDARGGS